MMVQGKNVQFPCLQLNRYHQGNIFHQHHLSLIISCPKIETATGTNINIEKYMYKKSLILNKLISKSKETTRLLAHDAKNLHMPLSLSSDSEENDDSDDDDFTSPSKQSYSGIYKRLSRKLNQWKHHHLTLSHKQKMVLKCSFAYMIGSLFTFVPALNALCGTHIASHMAATVTVFFNPAKSVGGMVEAAGFGWLYTLAALTLSIASMYTTDYFLEHHMPTTAAVVSLGVWLAGSTFVISYLKARINTPSILTGKCFVKALKRESTILFTT